MKVELSDGAWAKGGVAHSAQPFKDKNFAVSFLKEMIRIRVLEERLIKMVKSGEGHFWIGGPGEEAFQVSLGKLVHKGEGVEHDFLHMHYRNNGVAMAMGMNPKDALRQMRSTVMDPFSGGRNFSGHLSVKQWNIVPVTSTIETQFAIAIGTARAHMKQMRSGKPSGISIVIGGDAGTHEGEFASCMIWSARPGEELPLLMIVTNNQYGISTPAKTQHATRHISDRAKPFGIESNVADGTQPEKAWEAVRDAMEYVRSTGRPYMLELMVSRMNGHSSSSGANRLADEFDPIDAFQKKLVAKGFITDAEAKSFFDSEWEKLSAELEEVRQEPSPDPATVLDHSFAHGKRAGLPGKDC